MKNILVAVDFSDLSQRVVDTAIEVALATGAKIWLLHCVEHPTFVFAATEAPVSFPVSNTHLPRDYPAEHRKLNALNIDLRQKGIESETLFVGGNAADEILEAAAHNMIDLIILGSHGHGALYDLIMGSVTKSVLYSTTIPTMIVPVN